MNQRMSNKFPISTAQKFSCAARRLPSIVFARASFTACRSSQHPQRGLIQTDPPLWVGSYYRRSLLRAREDRHRDAPRPKFLPFP